MSVTVVMADGLLAVATFYIMNWLGGHVPGTGYMQLSVLYRPDEAPAFNFLFRAVAPLVAVTLYAAILYWLGFPSLVTHIWIVVPLTFAVRIIYNVVLARFALLNWSYQLAIALISGV